MCTGCIGRIKEIECDVPENELWELYRAAYEQYQRDVVNGGHLYDRYVKDFVSYHLPCFYRSKEAIRLHSMYLNNLHELLTERLDLVETFFAKKHFTEHDFEAMHRLFNTTTRAMRPASMLATFSPEEISLITQFVNHEELFAVSVSEQDVARFFNCTLDIPLQLTHHRHFALFMDALRSIGRLPFSWQKIIASNQLVASSETGRLLSANRIASALTQARAHPDGFDTRCSDFVNQLQEM